MLEIFLQSIDGFVFILGCFCTYSNPSSLEYIRDSLEKTLLSNLEQEDRLPFQGLPLVIVFAAEPNLQDKELLSLREEGRNLAERYIYKSINLLL